MGSLLIYVHFNRDQKLDPHVLYQLDHIRSTFDRVYFVSNSLLSANDLSVLKTRGLIDDFLQRPNEGYDFCAWSDAMKAIGFETLGAYDSVTLMNDTCFGPIFDLQPVFDRFQQDKDVDFWGMTNNRSQRIDPHRNHIKVRIPCHIQSYFITFKSSVVRSDSFKSFWSSIKVIKDVIDVIVKYETRMTEFFEKAGFKSAVAFDTRKEDWSEMLVHDLSVSNISAILEHRVPFLKVKAFAVGATHPGTPISMEYLVHKTGYPTQLIIDYMTWYDYPDRPYMLNSKMIDLSLPHDSAHSLHVGIHLHVFYTDLLIPYIKIFDEYVGKYDLYITTDTDENKKNIEDLISEDRAKEIMVVGEKGRDVLGWMKIHSHLSDYDIVGHFHTKRSAQNWWIIGEIWRENINQALLVHAGSLFSEIQKNENIGLIIPDVPAFHQSYLGPLLMDEGKVWDHMANLWVNIKFEHSKGIRTQDEYIMSYGTMVWYRPKALDNLLDLDIEALIPAEPLPDNTILHAVERLLVYVAWGNGYDFRIAHAENYNGFWNAHTSNIALRRVLMEIESKEDTGKDFIRTRDIVRLFFARMGFLIRLKLGGNRNQDKEKTRE